MIKITKQSSPEQSLISCMNYFSDKKLFTNDYLSIKQNYILNQIEKTLRGRFKKSENLERKTIIMIFLLF